MTGGLTCRTGPDGGREIAAPDGQVLGAATADHRGLTFTPNWAGRASGLRVIRLGGILPAPATWRYLAEQVEARLRGVSSDWDRRESTPLAVDSKRLAEALR